MRLDFDFLRLLLFRTIGNSMILFSLFIIFKTFGPIAFQELVYLTRQIRKVKIIVIQKNPTPVIRLASPIRGGKEGFNSFASLLEKLKKTEEIIVPTDPNFSLVIPKIGANSKVVQNVDPSNYDEYIEALKYGVAHARGTALPGDSGHIYLFAHSTDSFLNITNYNAVFYLLYKLEKGDLLYLFYQGKKFTYKVLDKKIIDPQKTEFLTRQSGNEFLTLQTCWPPGTTLQRLMIFASPVLN
mgnify:FL=1